MSKILRIDKINNQILQGAKAVLFQQKEIQNRAFFPVFQTALFHAFHFFVLQFKLVNATVSGDK